MSEGKPFGYEVVYAARVSIMLTEPRSFHGTGSAATMRRRALWKRGYVSLIELIPYEEEAYIRAFGIPGSRM